MALIELNAEQKLIQNEIRKFTQAEVDPIASDIDKDRTFPAAVIKKLAELGFLGAIIPDAYKGAGLDTTSLCIIIEELAGASASIAMIIAVQNCCVAYPLISFGSAKSKEKHLPRLATGTIGGYIFMSSYDCIENFQGAVTDSEVQVKGISDFVMNGVQAEILALPLKVQERMNMGVFNKPDTSIQEEYNMLGLRSAGITRMKLQGHVFSGDDLFNCEAYDQDITRAIAVYSNIGFAAISLGLAQACYQAAAAYARERKQFKRAICEFPMVREMLVDMKTRINAARLLVYDAAKRYDSSVECSVAAHTARLFCDETAVFTGTNSIQIHGGYGYTKDYPVERHFRDAKTIQVINMPVFEIKELIAKEILV